MSNYKIKQNYVVFQKTGEDSLGVNERAAELKDQKAFMHNTLTSVYPYLSNNREIWGRIKILLEGIKKSNITSLYSPDKIIKDKNDIFLVYEHKQMKNMEQILEDASRNNVPLNFDLALSIVLSIADLIDTGASIVVSGKKSFHGMLTPDNIFIDYDGKIFLKNYGIHQYLKSDEVYIEMTKKYGTWLSPEFLRKENIVSQSDIYHLGYVIYRMFTGKYITLTQGEDLNEKLANISFTCQLPSNDKDFINKIISFFKKTLNPDPEKRFSNIKEFKDFISANFHIEELSSVTFNLAYFMNSVYKNQAEREEEVMKTELQYEIPKEEEKAFLEKKEVDDHLVEDILSGLDDETSKARKPIIFGLVAVIALVIIGIFVIPILTGGGSKKAIEEQQATIARLLEENKKTQDRIAQLQKETTKTKKEDESKIQEIEALKEQQRQAQARLDELKKKEDLQQKQKKEKENLDNLQTQYNNLIGAAQTKIEENKFDDALKDLEAAKSLEKVKDAEQLTNIEKDLQTKKTAYEKMQEKNRIEEEARKKEEAEKNKAVKVGELVEKKYLTVQPVKVDGKSVEFTNDIKRKYRGKTFNIAITLLIDEHGNVKKVRFITSDNVPFDLQMQITPILNDWKYKPAEKNGVRVKVEHVVVLKNQF